MLTTWRNSGRALAPSPHPLVAIFGTCPHVLPKPLKSIFNEAKGTVLTLDRCFEIMVRLNAYAGLSATL